MARRDEIQDGTEELAIALVKAIKTSTDYDLLIDSSSSGSTKITTLVN